MASESKATASPARRRGRPPATPVPRLLTMEEASVMLGHVGIRTVQRLMAEHKLDTVDVGGTHHTRRIVADSVEAYLRRLVEG